MEPATGKTDLQGAYTVIKRGYHHMYKREPNPSRADMDKVTGDYVAMYWRKEPPHPPLPRRLVPTQVTPFRVNGNVPSEGEVEAEVQHIQLHKEGGYTHLGAEHFNKWLREAYLDERTPTPPRPER